MQTRKERPGQSTGAKGPDTAEFMLEHSRQIRQGSPMFQPNQNGRQGYYDRQGERIRPKMRQWRWETEVNAFSVRSGTA